MVTTKTKCVRYLCGLGVGLALLGVGSSIGNSAEPQSLKNLLHPLIEPQIIGGWINTKGEIFAVPAADGSKFNCSDRLEVGSPATIKSIDVYREAYVVDIVHKTYAITGKMGVPQRSCSYSWHEGRHFDGKGELVLDTWNCAVPPTKDVYIVVSVAIVELDNGQREVCRFRPLLFADGVLLTLNLSKN